MDSWFKADESYQIGPEEGGEPVKGYLNIEALIAVAKEHGVNAIHPGYGFLSENAGLARACRDNGIIFVGPTPELLEQFGDKTEAKRLAAESGVPVRGFSSMSDGEVAAATGLRVDQARLAKQREFDEPFDVLDGRDPTPLLDAIVRAGKQWSTGGRFHHITGTNDKARAVRTVIDLFRRQRDSITTIGLGDAPNDVEFLRAVDVPVVIASPRAADVARQVPGSTITREPGPRGWSETILSILDSGLT